MNSNNNAQNGSSLGRSVVPDLMRVYESLTQSSTPQESDNQTHHSQISQPQSYPQDPGNYPKNTSTPTPNPQFLPPDNYAANARHDEAHAASSQHQYYQAPSISPAPHEAHSLQHSNQLPDKVKVECDAQHFDSKIAPTLSKKGSSSSINDQQKMSSTDKQSMTGSASGSSTTKSRKKSGGSDGRWSKRFTWPDELHRDFVAAIFEVGLKHSSPSTILEHMKKHPDVTPERVKSHLQKYRLHRQKSKTEFMSNYDSTLVKIKSGEMDSYDVGSMNCAEVAAHLSHSTSNEHAVNANVKEQLYTDANTKLSVASSKDSVLQLPQLTDEEKQSPLGASMGYLMGLFFALRQQLLNQRATSGTANPAASASHSYYVQSTLPPPPLPPTSVPHYQSSTPPPQHSNNQIINISYEPPPEPPVPNPRANLKNNGGEYSPKKVSLYQAHQAHRPAASSKPSHTSQGRSVVHHYARWEVTETPYVESVPTSDPKQNNPPSHYIQKQIENQPHPKLSPRSSSQEAVAESHGPRSTPAQNITKQSHPQIVEYKTKENVPISPRNESHSDFVPEIRDKIEESNQMKREMQSQKEFQNKLRALKRKEISKCSSSYVGNEWKNHGASEPINPNEYHGGNYTEQSKEQRTEHRPAPGNVDQQPPTKRGRSESLAGVDDYWSSDMMDDHLFQFLINTDGD